MNRKEGFVRTLRYLAKLLASSQAAYPETRSNASIAPGHQSLGELLWSHRVADVEAECGCGEGENIDFSEAAGQLGGFVLSRWVTHPTEASAGSDDVTEQ